MSWSTADLATESAPSTESVDGVWPPNASVAERDSRRDEAPAEREHGSQSLGFIERTFREAFGVPFAVLKAEDLEILSEPAHSPKVDWLRWSAVCREVARRQEPEIIEDVAPIVLLAVPARGYGERDIVAVGLVATQRCTSMEECRAAAVTLGCEVDELHAWLAAATPWHVDHVLRVARFAMTHVEQHRRGREQHDELLATSSHLVTTYEEICLLHRLTEHLSVSSGEAELAKLAVRWLADVVPAEAVVLHLFDVHGGSQGQAMRDPAGAVVVQGELPLPEEQLPAVVGELVTGRPAGTIVANRLPERRRSGWGHPQVRDAVWVPILAGPRQRGWLLALNHTGDTRLGSRDFGSVEARLLGSVATILSIHGSNLGLFREQAEFFEQVVWALTSAIDAKDPYTCGHSDRVARVSVCLARQLGLDAETLNTMYLSGLLHDIGKIGIDDTVLRKPDRLTEEEFEHIKTHPELGYKILKGIKPLEKSLPVVLHHHEAWDGSGYPHGLRGEEIPRLARICAVADAFDAMGSDRPYRQGMPDDKVDRILREGAGKQWDAAVVEAFFAVREEIREVALQERDPLSLNVDQWQR